MARDDREYKFEKALARHLRADKTASSVAASQRCADAEILGAYQERQLAPDEMKSWKEHISSCSRCQEILANIQATDAATQESDTVIARTEQKTRVLQIAKPRRTRLWLWTAPAGAIAAGLLVWIVLQQKPQPMQLAKNQPVASSLPRAASPAESVPVAPQPETKRESKKLTPPSDMRSETGALVSRLKQSPKPTAPPPATKPSNGERDDALDSLNRSVSTVQPQPAQGDVSNQFHEFSKKHANAPGPPLPSVNQSVQVNAEAAEVATERPAPAPQNLAKAKEAISSPQSQSQQQEQIQEISGISRFRESPVMLLAGGKTAGIIATPNKKVSWRVGRAGGIARSNDAGASWSLQTSGVVNDLIAGSAPSDSVCWVVGQLGTILRTTDGGATWTKLQSPVKEDILSIFAVNAQQATISTAHGTYQTDDAGATWTKLPPE